MTEQEVEHLEMTYGIEEFDLKKHDFDLLDKVAEKIKQEWLFRGKDGKPYRDTIDEVIAEMKGEVKE